MKEKRFSPLTLILTAAAAVMLTLGAVALTAWLRLGPGGLAVLESVDLIQNRFVGDFDREEMTDSAMSAMVASLEDRWSLYLSKENYQAMRERRTNTYVGIGLTYIPGEDGSFLEIIQLVPGGPAEEAGLTVGDKITAIDGRSLTAEDLDALVATLKEEPGRQIALRVLSASGESREVTVVTASVDASAVTCQLLEGDIGYVRIANFYANSARDAMEAVDSLTAAGARALLFDVRGDPGGYISELTAILDYLLPEGPILTERDRSGQVHVTQSDGQCVDLPMAVLIDADSYSAAELFAAQLRESAAAPLIGVGTCGKGYYQQAFPLTNGGALNLSTGAYTTGKGVSLAGVGLTPDVLEEDMEKQVEQAVELLEEKLG